MDMSQHDQEPHELLKDHRESIDRLDAVVVYTLAERFKHSHAIGRIKLAHDLPVSDPKREASQMTRIEGLAANTDMDPQFACRLFRFIMDEVVKDHRLKKENQSTDN